MSATTTTTEKKHAKKAATKKAVVHEGTQAASSAPAAVVANTAGSSLAARVATATERLETAMDALALDAPALSPLQRKRSRSCDGGSRSTSPRSRRWRVSGESRFARSRRRPWWRTCRR